jgi:hemerythrin-like domain-containing protein
MGRSCGLQSEHLFAGTLVLITSDPEPVQDRPADVRPGMSALRTRQWEVCFAAVSESTPRRVRRPSWKACCRACARRRGSTVRRGRYRGAMSSRPDRRRVRIPPEAFRGALLASGPESTVIDPVELAERVRSACLEAALAAYEQAGISGLCGEGRWELAVQAIKTLELAPLLDTPTPETERGSMQRIEPLRRLSSEHHTGLVIARRARELAREPHDARDAAWSDLRQRFADELEPHFKLEERGLLPALQAVGEAALVERTLAEHRAMRAMIEAGGCEELAAFARLLTDHIRFEEKELFDTAQRVLDVETLARLRDLHDREAAPVCRA